MINQASRFVFVCSCLLFLNSTRCFSQTMYDVGFEYWKDLKVIANSASLANPWAGGLNNIQCGEIDLNMDGLNDLVLFDKHGNRLLPFIFHNATRTSPIPWYELDISYKRYFPPINSIFQLNDFDNDNRPDIFTYTTGGILVYRNISNETGLAFERETFPYIRSLQGNVYTNLLVTNVDYPGIIDLDNDGDLDILTFWGLGSFMDLHKNMSVETFGNADSLLFQKVDNCWGNFLEGVESNDIVLDTCLILRSGDRHTGSTISLLDVNNDAVLDLILGDVDYLNLKCLINGGTNIDAHITSVIDSFPEAQKVNLPSFPVMMKADIYNDGIADLLVSPFDPGLSRSDGYNSLWRYELTDTSMVLATKSFLQDEMIDTGTGCYPVFADLDNDGLKDLILGNYGSLDSCHYDQDGRLMCDYFSSLSYYKNTGTDKNPEYTFQTDDFLELSRLKMMALYPSFADLNADSDLDMIIGNSLGELWLYLSNGSVNGIPQFANPLRLFTGQSVEFITPAFVDYDNDGLIDFIAGNRDGTLAYYKNTGSIQEPSFTLITNHFGKVNVTDFTKSYTGYSVPAFFKDKSNKMRMVVGSESGKLFYFPDLASNPEAAIIAKNDFFDLLTDGIRTSASFWDINDDGFQDMIAGNYSGGVTMYKGITPGPIGISEFMPGKEPQMTIIPNPADKMVQIQLPSEDSWLITLTDIYGRHPESFYAQGKKIQYDIKQLKSGVYLVTASQLKNMNYKVSGKMVIIR